MGMQGKKPYLAVILIRAIYAGMYLLSKASFNGGMNSFIFIFYRQATASFFLIPLSIFLHWRNAPPLSIRTFCRIFMLSLCGITLTLDLNGLATVYTTATLAAATANCLPAITFFLAVLLGVEALNLRTVIGLAKVAGMVTCLGGAATLAFFKGPQFYILHRHHQSSHVAASGDSTWIKGCLLMLASTIFWGLWLILQGNVLESYPSELLFTTLQCLLSSIQSFVIAIAVERDPHQWKLGWDIKLIAVGYCGIVVTGVTYYLQSWVIKKKGPVFLAMSTPLSFVITIFSSAILMGESISLGSVLGGVLLIGGLYSVSWGKRRENGMVADDESRVDIEACDPNNRVVSTSV